MNMKSIKKMYEFLCDPVTNIKGIMFYCECGQSKATEIRQAAIKNFDGEVNLYKKLVKTDSVLRVIGTTREHELKIVSQALKDVGRLTN